MSFASVPTAPGAPAGQSGISSGSADRAIEGAAAMRMPRVMASVE